MEIVSVPIIASIVYALMEIYKKAIPKSKEKFLKLIPVIGAFVGTILGLIAFHVAPHIIGAENVVWSLILGAASGLTATGANQIVQQANKYYKIIQTEKEEEKEDK